MEMSKNRKEAARASAETRISDSLFISKLINSLPSEFLDVASDVRRLPDDQRTLVNVETMIRAAAARKSDPSNPEFVRRRAVRKDEVNALISSSNLTPRKWKKGDDRNQIKKGNYKGKCKFCSREHVFGKKNCPAVGKKCLTCLCEGHFKGSAVCKGTTDITISEFLTLTLNDNDHSPLTVPIDADNLEFWHSAEASHFENTVEDLGNIINVETVSLLLSTEDNYVEKDENLYLDSGAGKCLSYKHKYHHLKQ